MRLRIELLKISMRYHLRIIAITGRKQQRLARLEAARLLIRLAFRISSDAADAIEQHLQGRLLSFMAQELGVEEQVNG